MQKDEMVQAAVEPAATDGSATLSLVERLTAARKGARIEEDARTIADAQDVIERLSRELGEALAALKGLSDMYAHAWDTADGCLLMMGPSIPRFEQAHYKAWAVLNPEAAALEEAVALENAASLSKKDEDNGNG